MDAAQLREQIALIFRNEAATNASDPITVSLITRIANRIDALLDQVEPTTGASPPTDDGEEGG